MAAAEVLSQSLKSPDSFISHLSCLREGNEGAAGKKPLQKEKKKKKSPHGPNVSLGFNIVA